MDVSKKKDRLFKMVHLCKIFPDYDTKEITFKKSHIICVWGINPKVQKVV